MARQGGQQTSYALLEGGAIPKKADRAEAFLIAGGDRHKDYRHAGVFGLCVEPRIRRKQSNLNFTPVFARQAYEGAVSRRLEQIFAGVRLVKVGLTTAKDHDAAPVGIQHARGAFGEAFQKARKMARLRRVNGKRHQLIRLTAL